MSDTEFLLGLAARLERMQADAPNLNLHWFDVARLKIIAATLESQAVQIEGMKGAIEGLLTSKAKPAEPRPYVANPNIIPSEDSPAWVYASPIKPMGAA